jgi:adenine phosphoribosyltransferase
MVPSNLFLVTYSVLVTTSLGILLIHRKQRAAQTNNQAIVKYYPISVEPELADKGLVESCIQVHENFPKKGIVFRDIFPILRNPSASEALLRLLMKHALLLGKVDLIIGLETRGFLHGPILALMLNCAFAPVRKAGKLPGSVYTVSYVKEYGEDSFQIQADAITPGSRVLILDDLLATGGSLFAAVQLVEGRGASVIECMVIIELLELNGRQKVQAPVWSLFAY